MKHFYDGKRYRNIDRKADTRSLSDILWWIFFGRPKPWPVRENNNRLTPLKQRLGRGELSVTFINHATLLLQFDGLNLLTDPIWSSRCSPFRWIGPKRVIPPGIPLDALPPIDGVLVTHDHYDHMDRATLTYLHRHHKPQFFVSKGNRERLLRWKIENVTELNWWDESLLPNGQRLAFVPAQHFARRGLFDRNKTLWGGFVIHREGRPIYFAGDTGYGGHFSAIRNRYGPFRLACLPIGAYLPQWIMNGVHMGPAEAIQAHCDIEAEVSIPIHFGTFQLSDEEIDQPVEELCKKRNLLNIAPSDFPILLPGETLVLD